MNKQTLPALVYTVCRNLVSDCFRRCAFRCEYEHFLQSRGDGGASVESVFFAADIIERMEHGLARVPADCRDIYRMHVLGGMRVSEISDATGTKYKTVEYRLGLARRQVRRFLRAVV